MSHLDVPLTQLPLTNLNLHSRSVHLTCRCQSQEKKKGCRHCWTASQHRHVPMFNMQHIMRSTWSSLCTKWKASLQGAWCYMSFQKVALLFLPLVTVSTVAAHMQYASANGSPSFPLSPPHPATPNLMFNTTVFTLT